VATSPIIIKKQPWLNDNITSFLSICTIDENPKMVPSTKTHKQRTVAQALHDQSRPPDIQGGLSLIGLFKYFQLWDMSRDIHLPRMKMCIYGDWMARVVSPNLLIVLSSMEQSLLSIGVGYGNPGLHQNAKFFLWLAVWTRCWTWTDLRGEAFRVRPSVNYATRRKKTFNICSPHVCSPRILMVPGIPAQVSN